MTTPKHSNTTRMVPIVVLVTQERVNDLARVTANARLPEWGPLMERNGWTPEMLVGGALIDGALADAEAEENGRGDDR